MLCKNLNSLTHEPPRVSELFFAYAGFLVDTWKNVPCYLIDEELMLEICSEHYIPTWNEECLREAATHFPDNLKDIDKFWSNLEKCQDENVYPKSYHQALGIFIPNLDSGLVTYINELTYVNIPPVPSIFICPERIASHATEAQQIFPHLSLEEIYRVIFTDVYFHELTHAFTGRHNSLSHLWERIIDESLATATAHSLFPLRHEQAVLRFTTSRSPARYRSYNAWLEESWSSNTPRSWCTLWRYFHNDGRFPQDITPPRFIRRTFRSAWSITFRSGRRISEPIMQQPDFPELFWKGLAAILLRQALGHI